jgi:hypothetical protein
MLRCLAYGMRCAKLQDNCALTYSVRPALVEGPFFLHQGHNAMHVAPAKAGATRENNITEG